MRHRHKEIELRLLRTVALAFPNSLLLAFANSILVGFKGEGEMCIYMYIHQVYKIINSQAIARLRPE